MRIVTSTAGIATKPSPQSWDPDHRWRHGAPGEMSGAASALCTASCRWRGSGADALCLDQRMAVRVGGLVGFSFRSACVPAGAGRL